jgi:Zn-dependent metalloprotease
MQRAVLTYMHGAGAKGCGYLLSLLCLFSVLAPVIAEGTEKADRLLTSVRGRGPHKSQRIARTKDGYLRFMAVSPSQRQDAGHAVRPLPRQAARAWLTSWRKHLMDESPAVQFDVIRVKSRPKRSYVRFAQKYRGIGVFGAQVIVQLDDNRDVSYLLSDIMRNTRPLDRGDVSTRPRIGPRRARKLAVDRLSRFYESLELEASNASLMIYDPSVLGNTGPACLAWRMEVTNVGNTVLKDVVLVDAHSGRTVLRYPLIHDVLNRRIYDCNNDMFAGLGALVRSEPDPPTGILDVDLAYDYFGDTYDFYLNYHGRDSLDNAGMTLDATVRYCNILELCPWPNAGWDGSRVLFGDGFAQADDVVAHELTHGVTEHESNLIYSNQSGAMNESLSDMWGEWVDQTNGSGNDGPAVKWLMGEDLLIGPFRDMADPPVYGQPDRMGSPLWYTGSDDNGGVHYNSGVGNKLCYLLTDGDSFNGYAVSGMGIAPVAELFYECQTNLLTSASDYEDLSFALSQAAVNLGWTQEQQDNLEQACRAVEIIAPPEGVSGFVAASVQDDPNVTLSWTNPTQPGLESVIIRRSTADFPAGPSAGDAVYTGLGTSTVDGPLTIGMTYYYAAWAFYGGEEYSAPAHAQTVAGQTTTEYFTELFDASDNDLDNLTVTFTPDGSPGFYRACSEPATDFPTDPAGGTEIVLLFDGSEEINLADGKQVWLYGQGYSSFHVATNGYITFGAGDDEYDESLANHFDLPRISLLFDDLDPSLLGTVSWKQLPDRAAVTYEDAMGFFEFNDNDFQAEMFFDGRIRLTWLTIDAVDGLAGLSAGSGVPVDFVESDLSAYGTCIVTGDLDNDGDVDLDDLVALLAAMNGPNQTPGDPDADFDDDGDCDLSDFKILAANFTGPLP